ncbi:hypothetical protein [Rhodococcus sp. NPDC058514]|uniref:hypothetical protein n=1 Tax=unclassified Rhodococcus (in: high G+C Gram-positive bacteria) TaxID=192944 RepID=UPI0036487F02
MSVHRKGSGVPASSRAVAGGILIVGCLLGAVLRFNHGDAFWGVVLVLAALTWVIVGYYQLRNRRPPSTY